MVVQVLVVAVYVAVVAKWDLLVLAVVLRGSGCSGGSTKCFCAGTRLFWW